MGKGEIARNEKFLLFDCIFNAFGELPVNFIDLKLSSIISFNPKFVVWESVEIPTGAQNIKSDFCIFYAIC